MRPANENIIRKQLSVIYQGLDKGVGEGNVVEAEDGDMITRGRGGAEVRQFCKLDGPGVSLVRAAMGQINLSARGYHRVLKLARTIADLAGCENIRAAHLAEALQYRPKLMLG